MKLPFVRSRTPSTEKASQKPQNGNENKNKRKFLHFSLGTRRVLFWVVVVFLLVLVLVVVNIVFRKKSEWDVVDAAECEEMGGRYNYDEEYCILETRDEDWRCNSNSDCEGWCLAEEDAELGSKGYGKCSESFNVTGCIKFIDEGLVNSICMP